jgi:hypothetical protein
VRVIGRRTVKVLPLPWADLTVRLPPERRVQRAGVQQPRQPVAGEHEPVAPAQQRDRGGRQRRRQQGVEHGDEALGHVAQGDHHGGHDQQAADTPIAIGARRRASTSPRRDSGTPCSSKRMRPSLSTVSPGLIEWTTPAPC